jgi:hypothetical protein
MSRISTEQKEKLRNKAKEIFIKAKNFLHFHIFDTVLSQDIIEKCLCIIISSGL